MFDNNAKTELELMVGKDEKILWQGKPDKRCFVLEGMFNPMLPFAFLWGLVDLSIIIAAFSESSTKGTPIQTAFGVLIILFLHLITYFHQYSKNL